MYNEYKTSPSYYDSYTHKDDFKKGNSNRQETNNSIDRPLPSKTLRWNIEESKENLTYSKDSTYTASLTQLPRPELSSFNSNEYNMKKGWDKSYNDYSKSKLSKSFKTIKPPSELEYDNQFSKTYQSPITDFKPFDRKENFKGLTMSLDYKSNLRDLIPNLKIEQIRAKQSNFDETLKRLKATKSQKRINIEPEEPSSTYKQETPKSQLLKSYKRIADIVGDNKFQKNKEERQALLSSSKNKSIIDEIARKTQKTPSYNQFKDSEYELHKLKKHPTIDYTRLVTGKDAEGKSKLSIKDFQLGKCKGEGAFGQVFPAIHKATRMLVAIKKVPKQKVKYMLDQFINQIKIQMFLDHPNIVKLYAFFDDPTNFYIIMQYMEGGNLFGLIKKNKKISQNQTAQRLKEVCLALKQMHDNSILHRDIKPENIVLTNDVCKLCDFGWSAICKDRRTTYCGTLDYVSPEIIGGQGYDDSVDIWCIGVLAYEMICGKTPFYNISRKETMKKIVDVNYEYPPEITSKSKGFIDKILKKNPDDRMSIDEVLRDRFFCQ